MKTKTNADNMKILTYMKLLGITILAIILPIQILNGWGGKKMNIRNNSIKLSSIVSIIWIAINESNYDSKLLIVAALVPVFFYIFSDMISQGK